MLGNPRIPMLATAVLVLAPLAALSQLTPEERAENLRQVEKWRADPDHFARLRSDARAFLDWPPARQEQVLKLDRQLHALGASNQAHLLEVARRYTDWLDGLPEAERQRIKEGVDQNTRLQRIRALREQEWIRRLPRAQRDKVEKAQGVERGRLIQQYRREERQRRREWQIAVRHWDDLIKKHPLPANLTDFPQEVQTYVNEYLRRWLSNEEKTRLDKAEGRWPAFPYTLVALADKHPMALPGPHGPTHIKDLPLEVQGRLSAPRLKKPAKMLPLKKAEGKWPDFAIAVTTLARANGVRLPYELWPSRRDDLSWPVRQFVDQKLVPVLDEREKAQLKDAEWKWPLYPRTLQELAQKHSLHVPWQTLPELRDGPREKWDSYRLRPLRPASILAGPAS
jgi:hypothetical protein